MCRFKEDGFNFFVKLIVCLVASSTTLCIAQAQDGEFLNPLFHFPGGSDPFQGIILAIDLPLDHGGFPDVHFSLIFEAAYLLPTNETRFEYPPIIANRKLVYNVLEEKFKSYGYTGKDCLLRAICEAAQYSIQGTGVLGDLVHIILTPSSSEKEHLVDLDYEDSEAYGKIKGHCIKYRTKCSFGIIDKITKVFNVTHG